MTMATNFKLFLINFDAHFINFIHVPYIIIPPGLVFPNGLYVDWTYEIIDVYFSHEIIPLVTR